jgi:hypothetical protein
MTPLCEAHTTSKNLTLGLMIAGVLLIGVGHLASLPPFEGIDELGHYSSIQDIADTGNIPLYGLSFLSQSALDYFKKGPTRYGVKRPFDTNDDITYMDFFGSPDMVGAYKQYYKTGLPPARFRPGGEMNWQAQHPPLYYIVLAQVMKLVVAPSIFTQFFVLRLVSFLLALAGMGLALAGVRQAVSPQERATMDGAYLLYPLVLPMFFSEFARLGNDSLCLFFVGLGCFVLVPWLKGRDGPLPTLMLGFILALGLLTKALFIPVIAGLMGFLMLRCWRGRADQKRTEERKDQLVLLLGPIVLACFWYAYKLKAYGSLTGDALAISLRDQGGFLSNFLKNYSPLTLVIGEAMVFFTFIFGGTGSLGHLPMPFYQPTFLLFVGLLIAYLLEVRKEKLSEAEWLPVWLIAPLLVCLMAQQFVGIAATGSGATAGWYLHILAPAFAVAFFYGLKRLARHPWTRFALRFLLAYNLAMLFANVWGQLAMFSGCAGVGRNDKVYVFPNAFFCLDRFATVYQNLGVLGWPLVALIAYGLGFICYAWALVRYFRFPPPCGEGLREGALVPIGSEVESGYKGPLP